MRQLRISLVILFSFHVGSLFASNMPWDSGSPVIYGRYQGVETVNTMQIKFYDYYFRFVNEGLITKMDMTLGPDGMFSFHLPVISHPGYFTIVVNPGDYEKKLMELYLVEPSDSIEISINKNNIMFAGRGNTKYACRYMVDHNPSIDAQNEATLTTFNRRITAKTGNYFQYLMQDKKRADSLLDEKFKAIDDFKPALSPLMNTLMKADYAGKKYSDAFYCMRLYYTFADSTGEAPGDFIQFYHVFYENWLADTTHSDILIYSKSYDNAIINYAKLSEILKTNHFDVCKIKYPMSALYNHLDLRYESKLKERVITGMMLEMFNFLPGSDEYLEKALHQVTRHEWWVLLQSIASVQMAGAPIYPFSLPDSNGNPVDIKDFKGKVVVIDFWYTGCGACRFAGKGLKHVAEYYKSDTNIVFMSVSVDGDGAKWKKSLVSQSYTGPGEINLYTNGLGSNHPIINLYDFDDTGYPRIFIIDRKGRIYSTHPQLPWDDVEETILSFRKELDKAAKM